MVAMFIIFDFVIKNPLHSETKTNLSYLDIVAAHFARLDLASKGTLHDAKVSEFTAIARLYVDSFTTDHNRGLLNDPTDVSTNQGTGRDLNIQDAATPTQNPANGVLGQDNMDIVSIYPHLTLPSLFISIRQQSSHFGTNACI